MSTKTTLLEKLLDKASEAIGIRKKALQRKLIERSLEKSFDKIEEASIDAEGRKLRALERLAVITSEEQGVNIFKELAQAQQELNDCKNTKTVLSAIKDELNSTVEEE